MAKMTKDELMKQINESALDTDAQISLMENVSDSIADESEELANKDARIAELEAQVSSLQTELEEFKNKYKERFLNSIDEVKDEVEKAMDSIEEVKEEVVSEVVAPEDLSTEIPEEELEKVANGEVINVTEI